MYSFSHQTIAEFFDGINGLYEINHPSSRAEPSQHAGFDPLISRDAVEGYGLNNRNLKVASQNFKAPEGI